VLSPSLESQRAQNLRTLIWRNFLVGWRQYLVRAAWQPFVLSLGASMSLVGLLESIGGWSGVVSTAMLPLGGLLADRHGRRRFVILSSVLTACALLLYALAGWLHDWRWLLPGVLLLGLASIARPAIDAMTAESAAIGAFGWAYGLVSMSFAAAGILAPTLGGWLAGRYGYVLVLLLGVTLELLIGALVILALRETFRPHHRKPFRLPRWVDSAKMWLIPPPHLRAFYVAVTVDIFAFGVGSAILPGMLAKTYGFTALQLGIMGSISSASWAVSQMVFARWVDRRGSVPMLIFSESLGVVLTAAWLFSRSFPAFAALEIVTGVLPATWVPAYMAYMAKSVPAQQRAQELGRLGAFRGLWGFPASYIGGMLYDRFGIQVPILLNMVGAAIVVVIFWLSVREPQSTELTASPLASA
jgi:MFS family permease